MARRVHTEQVFDYKGKETEEDENFQYNVDDLSDEDEDEGQENVNNKGNDQKRKDGQADGGADDLLNYKGIYFGDDNQKYTDPENGAHFEFNDMCRRLKVIRDKRKAQEQHQQTNLQKVKEDLKHSLNALQSNQQQPKVIDTKPIADMTASIYKPSHVNQHSQDNTKVTHQEVRVSNVTKKITNGIYAAGEYQLDHQTKENQLIEKLVQQQ